MKQSREELLKQVYDYDQLTGKPLEISLRDENDELIPNVDKLIDDSHWLKQNGYLDNSGSALGLVVLSITDKGERYVHSLTEDLPIPHVKVSLSEEEHKRLREKDAEEKAENQRDRKVQVISSILGAVIGSLLTLLIEHFQDIVEFIGSFFS